MTALGRSGPFCCCVKTLAARIPSPWTFPKSQTVWLITHLQSGSFSHLPTVCCILRPATRNSVLRPWLWTDNFRLEDRTEQTKSSTKKWVPKVHPGYKIQSHVPVVPARGGAEVALKIYIYIYIRPFSSIELAWAVRQPSPCACALCESCVLFHMSDLKLHFALPTSHCSLHTPHCTLHTSHFSLHSSRSTLHTALFTLHTSSHLSSSHLIPAHLFSSHLFSYVT